MSLYNEYLPIVSHMNFTRIIRGYSLVQHEHLLYALFWLSLICSLISHHKRNNIHISLVFFFFLSLCVDTEQKILDENMAIFFFSLLFILFFLFDKRINNIPPGWEITFSQSEKKIEEKKMKNYRFYIFLESNKTTPITVHFTQSMSLMPETDNNCQYSNYFLQFLLSFTWNSSAEY